MFWSGYLLLFNALIVLVKNFIYFALIRPILIGNLPRFFKNPFGLIVLLLLRFIKFVDFLFLLIHYLVFSKK
jgi:hypothetical protein